MMRPGRALMVTAPLAARPVRGDVPVLVLADAPALDELPDEPQPASRADAAKISTPAATRTFMLGNFLPERRDGRRDRQAAAGAAAGPGRIALATRVDCVERGRRRPGLGLFGRHSCGTAPEWSARGLHRLRCLERYRSLSPSPAAATGNGGRPVSRAGKPAGCGRTGYRRRAVPAPRPVTAMHPRRWLAGPGKVPARK